MNANPHVCPYIDRGDARCAERLTLVNLQDSFRFCAGQHRFCRVYYQIRIEQSRRTLLPAVARSA